MSPIHRLTVKRGLILDADDTVQVGKAATVTLKTGTAGDYYQVAASLSTLPVNLGKCILHLTPDDLFWVSIQVGPPLFTRYAGKLDTTGGGSARLGVPNLPSLAGVIVYHAAIAYDLTGITACTNNDSTRIIP